MDKMTIIDQMRWSMMVKKAVVMLIVGITMLGWSLYRFLNPVTPLVELPFENKTYPMMLLFMAVGWFFLACLEARKAFLFKKNNS